MYCFKTFVFLSSCIFLLSSQIFSTNCDTTSELSTIKAIESYGGFYKKDSRGHVIEVNLVYHNDIYGKRTECYNQSDSLLNYLPNLTYLSSLSLQGMQISDSTVKYLSLCINVRKINMWGPRISDSSCRYLVPLLSLEELHISDAGLSNKALEFIGKLVTVHRIIFSQGLRSTMV